MCTESLHEAFFRGASAACDKERKKKILAMRADKVNFVMEREDKDIKQNESTIDFKEERE